MSNFRGDAPESELEPGVAGRFVPLAGDPHAGDPHEPLGSDSKHISHPFYV